MAFSFKKILSNINYFKKTDTESPNEGSACKKRPHTTFMTADEETDIKFDFLESDLNSTTSCKSQLPETSKELSNKQCSLTDTDLSPLNKKDKRKKPKLDLKKAFESADVQDSFDIENTPKHILLNWSCDDLEEFKGFDFSKSFDTFNSSDINNETVEEALSEPSETDSSSLIDKDELKMCHKVIDPHSSRNDQLVSSTSTESFEDVEFGKNEEDRLALLQNYQTKLENTECFLKKLLQEFSFHIEVSRVFTKRTFSDGVVELQALTTSHINEKPENADRTETPTACWNIIIDKEDEDSKMNFKQQLQAMKQSIEDFLNIYLHKENDKKKCQAKTYQNLKRRRISKKKKVKYYEYPDIRDAMIQLFTLDTERDNTSANLEESVDICQCECQCHHYHRSSSESDSGLTQISNSTSNQSITSSIGNFTLDSSALTAYSESLDLIVSYDSFDDSTLYSSILHKAAIERITFYVQVHSIQLRYEDADEMKNRIYFHCPACIITEHEENGLLKHILSQRHCEKIHFLYKTAYTKKCMATGKEIQPSTVLNPMTMYRDDNKIVCFGDAIYACSLCLENLIIGESVLMNHCSDAEHLEKKKKLLELE